MDLATVFGSAATCVVASGGLTNGAAADTDDRLRQRLLKLLREPRNGGCGRTYRQWAEDASAAVENAYVYPAAQGRGPCMSPTPSRAPALTATPAQALGADLLVADAITAEQPEFADVTVTTVAHADLALALKITLPEPPSGGGPVVGGGRVHGPVGHRQDRRRQLERRGHRHHRQLVHVLHGQRHNQPVDGSTVAFFSSTDRAIVVAVVVVPTGSAGRGCSAPTRSPTVSAGDYVMPACEQGETYAEDFMARSRYWPPARRPPTPAYCRAPTGTRRAPRVPCRR